MKHLGEASFIGLLACLLVGNAWADRYYRHPRNSIHWGISIGIPWVYPPYYSYPYSTYTPPVVIVPAAPPPVYIEQEAAPAMEPGFWYYCIEAQAYYPHVQQCPGPWQKVAPQAPRQ